MLFSTVGQAYVFLVTVALGAVMGLGHDFVQLLSLISPSRVYKWLLEAAFWAICVYAMFQVLMQANGGELRAYTVLGMGVGWCLYLLSISRVLHLLAKKVKKAFLKIKNSAFVSQFLR